MTDAERLTRHVTGGGKECPVCGGDSIAKDSGAVGTDGTVTVRVMCRHCNAVWTDRYALRATVVTFRGKRETDPLKILIAASKDAVLMMGDSQSAVEFQAAIDKAAEAT